MWYVIYSKDREDGLKARLKASADADPYIEAGAYESVEVSPFIRVMPK